MKEMYHALPAKYIFSFLPNKSTGTWQLIPTKTLKIWSQRTVTTRRKWFQISNASANPKNRSNDDVVFKWTI